MQQVKLDLANLQWQLELLLNLDPPIIGVALQELGTYLTAAEPEEQAADILTYFIKTGFAGLGPFLGVVEASFNESGPLPAVVCEIFTSWEALASLGDAELPRSADIGNVVALFPENNPRDKVENKSVKIIGSHERGGFIRLFDPFDLYEFGRKGTTNPYGDFYHKRVITELARLGPNKRYTFEQDALEKLSELRSLAPNFTEVTECLLEAVYLAMRSAKPIRITPILLVGEPGIGKSHYTAELSRCLGVPMARVAVDNLQVGAGLAGSSHIYANSEPGVVFRVLSEQNHISPLVILDELDKAEVSYRGDPLNPLHNLLEPVSAREFRDESISMPIDASHVIWIATANYLGKIPHTITSRFEVFEIPAQSQETKEAILRVLCAEFKKEYPDIEFSQEVIRALLDKTPREQRQLLQRALSRTAWLGEATVCLDHLVQVAPDIRPQPSKRVLGYL